MRVKVRKNGEWVDSDMSTSEVLAIKLARDFLESLKETIQSMMNKEA